MTSWARSDRGWSGYRCSVGLPDDRVYTSQRAYELFEAVRRVQDGRVKQGKPDALVASTSSSSSPGEHHIAGHLHWDINLYIMVLFHLTAGLESRLRSLDLPAELSAIVLSHVSRGENDEAGADEELATEKPRPKSTAKTIDHTVLVRVARHYRMLRERSCTCCNARETVQRCATNRALTSACTLASLLALTDIYAPSLPVREKVSEQLCHRGALVHI